METKELLKKVRKIEIKSRGLTNQIFSGEYHSAFKGRGMVFSEVREYQYGDAIRTIDWNVTARFNHPFVKVFEEERELTFMLLIDVSASENFGSKNQLKKDLITEISAVLAFSAAQNNDKVGVIFFSDKIEKFIPPKKGRSHILRIIRELIELKPEHKKTDINQALIYLNKVIKKKSTAFILSDFQDKGYDTALKISNKKHDLIALQIVDPLEQHIPNIGIIQIRNTETDELFWLDTGNAKQMDEYHKKMLQWKSESKDIFRRSGVDFIEINTHYSYIKPLMNLFKKRGA